MAQKKLDQYYWWTSGEGKKKQQQKRNIEKVSLFYAFVILKDISKVLQWVPGTRYTEFISFNGPVFQSQHNMAQAVRTQMKPAGKNHYKGLETAICSPCLLSVSMLYQKLSTIGDGRETHMKSVRILTERTGHSLQDMKSCSQSLSRQCKYSRRSAFLINNQGEIGSRWMSWQRVNVCDRQVALIWWYQSWSGAQECGHCCVLDH